MRTILLFIFAVSTVAGCSVASTDMDDQTSTEAFTKDQQGLDVQVLEAKIGKTFGRTYENGYQLGDIALDRGLCSENDCSKAAQAHLKGLLVGGFKYNWETSGQCEIVEVKTVTRNSSLAAETFRG